MRHAAGFNEIELKLRISTRDVARLRQHRAITGAAVAKPVTRKLTSIYYDTPQLALYEKGLSLRVRRMSGKWFQAVKAAGDALAGLHQRMEWEDIIASGHPDFSKIVDPALTQVFDDASLRESLIPIFTTEVRRTEWQMLLRDGSQVELALDQGRLIAGEHIVPLSEIELELKQGQAASLFELALALQQDIPLSLENVSKAQLGYDHYRPRALAVAKAGAMKLQPHMPAAAAFRAIVLECIAHLQGNQDMVLRGEDIEGVHQMRVALRRLRSAHGVFRNALGEDGWEEIRQEIVWITGHLGQARDLDVFLSETLPPILSALPEHRGLRRLLDKAVAARQASYQQLRAALGSPRYQRLLLLLGAWLERLRWPDPNQPTLAVSELARAMLSKRHRQLRRHGRRLDEKHPEERHAARIAGKKLRYAAEFFASLYPAGKTAPYINCLSRLQDVLGTLNDIAVTESLVRQLTGKKPGILLGEALAVFIGWNACHVRQQLDQVGRTWGKFVRKKPYWR